MLGVRLPVKLIRRLKIVAARKESTVQAIVHDIISAALKEVENG